MKQRGSSIPLLLSIAVRRASLTASKPVWSPELLRVTSRWLSLCFSVYARGPKSVGDLRSRSALHGGAWQTVTELAQKVKGA